MKKVKWMGVILFLFLLFSSSTALAHVKVMSEQDKQGMLEKYIVQVPCEKNMNTTQFKIEFPEDVTIESVIPTNGWSSTFVNPEVGSSSGIVWKTTSGGIKPKESVQFSFVAKNPDEGDLIHWQATQTYQDGSVDHWNGSQNTKTYSATPKAQSLEQRKATAFGGGIVLAIFLSVFALIISILSYFKWRRN